MDSYQGTKEGSVHKKKTKWTSPLTGVARGAEFSVGSPSLWTIDNEFQRCSNVESNVCSSWSVLLPIFFASLRPALMRGSNKELQQGDMVAMHNQW